MRAYSNMPNEEFLYQLREAAIRAKAAPAVIDQIDSLGSVQDLESALEKVGGELSDMENDRDDLRGELNDLIQSAIDNLDHIPSALISSLRIAASALERHGYAESDVASIKRALAAP